MSEILQLLRSPEWWFTTILAGVIVNVASHALIKKFPSIRIRSNWLDWAFFLSVILNLLFSAYLYFASEFMDISSFDEYDLIFNKFTFFFLMGIGVPVVLTSFFYILSDHPDERYSGYATWGKYSFFVYLIITFIPLSNLALSGPYTGLTAICSGYVLAYVIAMFLSFATVKSVQIIKKLSQYFSAH